MARVLVIDERINAGHHMYPFVMTAFFESRHPGFYLTDRKSGSLLAGC